MQPDFLLDSASLKTNSLTSSILSDDKRSFDTASFQAKASSKKIYQIDKTRESKMTWWIKPILNFVILYIQIMEV